LSYHVIPPVTKKFFSILTNAKREENLFASRFHVCPLFCDFFHIPQFYFDVTYSLGVI